MNNQQHNNPTQPQMTQQAPPVLTLEDQLKKLQDKWTAEITELNGMMKTIQKLDELLNIIYTKRQEAVDYYHGINTVILKQSKEYKVAYNGIINRVRQTGMNGVRVQNESALGKIAENELVDKKESIDLLANHNSFIKETIQTIDNMIYGINQKVKIAEMLNGIKF